MRWAFLLWAALLVGHCRGEEGDAAAANRLEFSCGDLFYRTLHLKTGSDGEETLYVGAMDHVFRLPADNVSRADCAADSLHLPASNAANCVSKGKSEDFDCRNHIRVLQPVGQDQLYICGTNAHAPRDLVVYANLTRLARHEFFPGVGDGVAKCPFDPKDNSTALWVHDGNPGGHPAIYSGTNAEFTKADTVIFRGDIFDERTGRREYSFKRTIKYDSHMLDKPDFVGSFDVGEYVYFFFRENAVEFMNCGKTIYSRVARVCKRDVGGKNILVQNWATYLKARLNCSVPGEFPFFFDEIQDVFKTEDDDSVFHAVFSTGRVGLTGSAVCSFRMEDLDRTFNEGKFKEQATSTSVWLPVPTARVPTPRPGSCVEDTRHLSDTVLNFIRKHPLMDSDVSHDGGSEGPVFYRRGVVFTKLVVDRVASGSYDNEQEFHVYFAGTDHGEIYKISRWNDEKGQSQSQLLDVLDITGPDPIRALRLSRHHQSLYASSDRAVVQLKLPGLCTARHHNCARCVRDPYCGWDGESGRCRPKHFSLLQDPAGKAPGICEGSVPSQRITANFGQAVHLACSHVAGVESSGSKLAWFHFDARGNKRRIYFKEGTQLDQKHLMTQDGGLVVLGVTERDSGHYKCQLGRQTIAAHHLSVDAHRCSAPGKTGDYQRIYSEWCHEYQKYKSALQSWEKRQNKCAALAGPDKLHLLATNTVKHHNQVYSPLV